jgi:hypothetical protein
LEKLNLSDNKINNCILAFAGALAVNSKLREQRLSYNIDVTTIGWQTFSTVLESPTSGLEKLDLSGNAMNSGVLSFLCERVG